MSAPVLSLSEQKAAISGKKKKKKTMKSVLGIPSHLKVESHAIEVSETEKLSEILERLLPSARLSVQQNFKCFKDSKENNEFELQQIEESKKRRNQLSLGVNDLSRSIKKALISAVLMAADIQPKFLIHHLNLQCKHNNIPFLHMRGLREVTKNTLGFPCIAIGFKKNFFYFSDVVEEIKFILKGKKIPTTDSSQEAEMESGEESEKGTSIVKFVKSEEPFSYLIRTSAKERIFVPELCSQHYSKQELDFVKLPKDESETNFKYSEQQLGISCNSIRKHEKKLKSLKEYKRSKMENEGEDNIEDDGDLEVPKKKVKKAWVIDKVGNRPSYYPANLIRVPSNANRSNRK